MPRLTPSLFLGLLFALAPVALPGARALLTCDPASPACPASDPYCTMGNAIARCTECSSGTDYVCDCTHGLVCNVPLTSTLSGTCTLPPLLGARCNSGADCTTYYYINNRQTVASQLQCISGYCAMCNWVLDKGPHNCTYGSKEGQSYTCSANGVWQLLGSGPTSSAAAVAATPLVSILWLILTAAFLH